MEQEKIYCVGKLGGPVRLIIEGLKSHAFSIKAADEVVCLLHTKPTSPSMILADGSDVVPITQSLEYKKSHMWSWVKERRVTILAGGCLTPLGRVDTDDKSRNNISDAVSAARDAKADAKQFSEEWRMADNSYQEHDADQMIALGAAVRQFTAAVYAASFEFSKRIELAPDTDALQALDPATIAWPV